METKASHRKAAKRDAEANLRNIGLELPVACKRRDALPRVLNTQKRVPPLKSSPTGRRLQGESCLDLLVLRQKRRRHVFTERFEKL